MKSSTRPYFPRVFGKHPNFGEQKFSKTNISGFCAKQLTSLLRGSDVVVQSVPTFLEYTECNEEEETNFANFTLTCFAEMFNDLRHLRGFTAILSVNIYFKITFGVL